MTSLNPFLWLHPRIGGNLRTYLLAVAAFPVLVIVFAGFSYWVVDPKDRAPLDGVWLMIISVAQGAFLLLLAPAAVRRAVQRDFQSGMIESHRISPMSNLTVVLGYMIGPPLQSMLLYAASVALGTFFLSRFALTPGQAAVSGLGRILGGWYFAQGCLLVLAFAATAFVLVTALSSAGKTNALTALMIAGILGGWSIVYLVPGLALLLGLLSTGVLLSWILPVPTIRSDPGVIFTAAVLQLATGLLLLGAACRKFRAPHRSLFSIPAALLLLVVFGVALAAGAAASVRHAWLFADWGKDHLLQHIASVVAFMLVAQFAVVAAADRQFQRDRAAAFGLRAGSRGLDTRLVPIVLAALTAALFALLLPLFEMNFPPVAPSELAKLWATVAAGLLLSFWTDYHLVVVLRRGKRLLVGLLIFIAMLKIAPVMIDTAANSIAQDATGAPLPWRGFLAACSPIGTLLLSLEAHPALWPGLVVQVLPAIVATRWARRTRTALRTTPQVQPGTTPTT